MLSVPFGQHFCLLQDAVVESESVVPCPHWALCLRFIIPEITELSSYKSRLFKLVNHANKSLPQNIEYIVVFLAKTRPLRNAKCTFNHFLVSRLSRQIWPRRVCGD